MITYGDLYDYLELKLPKYKSRNNGEYKLTQEFCKKNNVSSDRLVQILFDFGGHNDLEVLINVARFIPDNTPIDKNIETPVEFAIKHNYYAKFHEGMWVRCKKDDTGAIPDLNTAYQKMFDK